MKTLDPALIAHLGSREPLNTRLLVWFDALALADGSPAPWGVWTGEDDRIFTIDGQPRTYFGAGAMGEPGELTHEAGYVVRLYRVALSHLHADVAPALALTRLRLRPVEIHQVHLAPGSHDLVAPPLQKFRGRVETLTLPRAEAGKSAMAEVQIASTARDMTLTLDITRSDATLRMQHPTDGFRKYAAITAKVTTAWGEIDGTPQPPRPNPWGTFSTDNAR
jgi:hypothetical protein